MMKIKNLTLSYIVLVAGLALIFTGFFLFVPDDKRNDIFWLDLAVACFVFLVASFTELIFFGVNKDFEKQVGSLGIRFVYVRFYVLAAIAIIIIGYFDKVGFRLQLFFQLLAAFILLLGYFFSHLSSSKVVSVKAEQEMQRRGKDEILRTLNQFEILITKDTAKFGAEKQKIDALKETVRYLSPTNNQSANEIDAEIATTIQQAYAIAKDKDDGKAEVFSLLNRCEELLKLRKNSYSN